MTERLPPLNALRAFEAAARHRNMSRAAEELFVTPAAVSHQVIALETHLGRKLFERLQHGLALTADGERYLPYIARAFDSLRQAGEQFDEAAPVLTISVPPAFSAKWLLPRLESLQDELSAVSIVNEKANDRHDRLPNGADVAIRYGAPDKAGAKADLLLDEAVIPVCHPNLLAGGSTLREPSDLLGFDLLVGRASLPGEGFPDWRTWFGWLGVERAEIPASILFDHHLMTVQAALEGRGVALAKRSIVMTDLIRGNLVQLADAAFPLAFAHFLISGQGTTKEPDIAILRQWLERELRDSLEHLPAAILSVKPPA